VRRHADDRRERGRPATEPRGHEDDREEVDEVHRVVEARGREARTGGDRERDDPEGREVAPGGRKTRARGRGRSLRGVEPKDAVALDRGLSGREETSRA
jgi:hypothetical protein